MKRICILWAATLFSAHGPYFTQVVQAQVTGSEAQQVLSDAARDQKYTFILFYQDDSPSTKTMAQSIRNGVATRQDRTTQCAVWVNDAKEKALVDRFGVARAPMPLTVAVAPNGAITGIFPQKITETNIESAFGTATMLSCLKAMQEGKLVMVCANVMPQSPVPQAVRDFQSDPHFKNRLAVFSMQVNDPKEKQFLDQMQINPLQVRGQTTIFLAPPGVLVGKYGANATRAEMATALHNAGKCCDDPNCKHNHTPAPSQPVTTRQANQAPGAKRN